MTDSVADSHQRARGALFYAREIAVNIFMAVFVGRFVLAFGSDFYATGRISSLIAVVKIGLDVLFYLSRRFPKETCFSLYAWTSAAGGTFLPLFFMPVPSQQFAAAQAIQVLGLVLQVAAIVSLNRSFGVVPANRGIKTNGFYSVVRHPIYTSYVVGLSGLLINHFSALNLIVFITYVVFQLLRIHYEEDFLMSDPDYRAFAKRTKWRLIPLVF